MSIESTLSKKQCLLSYFIVLACTLITLTLLPTNLAGAASLIENAPTLVVSGSASLNSAPDKASISMAVISIEKTVQEAQQKNNVATTTLINSLISHGIANEDIITNRYNLWPQYDYSDPSNGKNPTIKGYEIRNEITVTVIDISRLGIVLDAAIQSGANSINSIQFDKTDKSMLENSALTQAVHNAHAKASSIASALGMKLGSIVTVNESGFQTILPLNSMQLSNIKAEGMGGTPINSGPINVQANILITYQLQN